jgi:uncharacterized circularly permuted ATP-grasp superfamily protein/uncharacterized alpha-E superfamily protein
LRERWNESEWTPWSGPAGRSLAAPPWRQDPLPCLLREEEWNGLETGLLQRVRFLERLAEDLYGDGLVLRQGLLPSRVVHANPAYLWPMVGTTPCGGWLDVAAFDVVRTANGWTVLEDHLQEPRGLERVSLLRARTAQAFPEILRELRPAQELAGIGGLRDLLEGPLASGSMPERVAILAPDLDEAPSPEFVALARRLGVELVDGEDLAVRRGRLWLRTVEGLLPVRGLLRFLPDAWSDPLELRPDTGPGVPALCQAVRSGSLRMANPPGVGVLESAALWPHQDDLCQLLLGEPLRMAVPRSVSCDDPEAWREALEDCSDRIFKRAFPDQGGSLSGASLVGFQAQGLLAEKIRSSPFSWIAQERVEGECLPLCGADGIELSPAVLRLFAAKGPDGWKLLPGGFAQMTSRHALGKATVCKDLWVPARGGQGTASWRPQGIRRSGGEVPSRVAENLWWMGRYAERSELRVRTLRSLLLRLEDDAGDARALSTAQTLAELAEVDGRTPTELAARCFDVAMAAAVQDLRSAVRNAWAVRERLSDDTARVVERLERDALRGQQTRDPAEAARRLTGILLDLAALSGLGSENTVRGHGWSFLGLGRRLERAMGIIRQMQLVFSAPTGGDATALSALLEVWDSTLTYRSRYMALPAPAQTADLLLLDATNPRSLAFQIAEAVAHLRALPRAHAELAAAESLREALQGELSKRLDGLGEDAVRIALAGLFASTSESLARLATMLETRQFAHVEPAWQGERP